MKRSVDLPLEIRPVVGLRDRYPAGHVDAYHSHGRAQLSYTLEGVLSVTTGNAAFVLPPNRAIWLPAGTVHQVSCRCAVTFNLLYIEPALALLDQTARVFEVPPLLHSLIQEILTFDHAYDETGREGRIVALALEEVGRLPTIPLSVPMPTDRRLRRVCDLIVARPADQRDLDDLAREAAMGRRTFTRAFRQQTGLSFAAWRQQVRLMAAISLIGEGHPITTVAYEVGYESASSFAAMFHRALGVPPRRYGRLPDGGPSDAQAGPIGGAPAGAHGYVAGADEDATADRSRGT